MSELSYNSSLTQLVLPPLLEVMAGEVFRNNPKLQVVPDSVTIWRVDFCRCDDLRYVTFPKK
jgi:hypothetical protein